MSEQKIKSWKVAATFDNFKDADECRNNLKDKHTLVKVKRGLNVYRVKTWDDAPDEKEKKKGKKVGKNKKVRSGRKKS